MTGIDRATVERFRGDVERVAGRPLAPGERMAFAVSGGPDSMTMLALAAVAFAGQVIAATVDHGLRAGAADEALMVAAWCRAAGVEHRVLVVREPIGTTAVQARARDRRYALLLRWAAEAGARLLATAHHADDQAETFLMRAARGSGVAGLAGIRPRKAIDTLDIVRPLLDWRAAELRAVATRAALPFVDDPSNADDRYERTRIRALLRDTPWLDPRHLARTAAHAAHADAALREIEAWLWATRKVEPSGIVDRERQRWLDIADLPRELKRRLVRAAIRSVRSANGIARPAFDDSANVEALLDALDALDAGTSATQAGVMVSAKGSVWRFAAQPPRRAA